MKFISENPFMVLIIAFFIYLAFLAYLDYTLEVLESNNKVKIAELNKESRDTLTKSMEDMIKLANP